MKLCYFLHLRERAPFMCLICLHFSFTESRMEGLQAREILPLLQERFAILSGSYSCILFKFPALIPSYRIPQIVHVRRDWSRAPTKLDKSANLSERQPSKSSDWKRDRPMLPVVFVC